MARTKKRRRGKRARRQTVPSLLPLGPFELPQLPDLPLPKLDPGELVPFTDLPALVLELEPVELLEWGRKRRRKGGS
jgi:hypothetical protein